MKKSICSIIATATLASLMYGTPSHSAGDPKDTAWNRYSPGITLCVERRLLAVQLVMNDLAMMGKPKILTKAENKQIESDAEAKCVCTYYSLFNNAPMDYEDEYIADLITSEKFIIKDLKEPGYSNNRYNVIEFTNKLNLGLAPSQMLIEAEAKCDE